MLKFIAGPSLYNTLICYTRMRRISRGAEAKSVRPKTAWVRAGWEASSQVLATDYCEHVASFGNRDLTLISIQEFACRESACGPVSEARTFRRTYPSRTCARQSRSEFGMGLLLRAPWLGCPSSRSMKDGY